jgi:hypothetical protein
VAYNLSATEDATGPVLGGCTLGLAAAEAGSSDGSEINITLHFRQDLLRGDAVMVGDPLMQALSLADPISGWPGQQGEGASLGLLGVLGTSSPLQIEINGNESHSGTWLPVNARAKCQPEHYDHLWPNRSTCLMDRDNWTRKAGWADVVIQVGKDPFMGAAILKNITGVRYAWGTNVSPALAAGVRAFGGASFYLFCCALTSRWLLPCLVLSARLFSAVLPEPQPQQYWLPARLLPDHCVQLLAPCGAVLGKCTQWQVRLGLDVWGAAEGLQDPLRTWDKTEREVSTNTKINRSTSLQATLLAVARQQWDVQKKYDRINEKKKTHLLHSCQSLGSKTGLQHRNFPHV